MNNSVDSEEQKIKLPRTNAIPDGWKEEVRYGKGRD